MRRPDHEDKFDFTTLYNDIFWSKDGNKIILVGPPHMNLGQDTPIQYTALPSGETCRTSLIQNTWADRVELEPPAGTTGLAIECANTRFITTPQPYMGSAYRGKKVIFTMSKNNELNWIHDWALFYSTNHGCDAILFYDNMSDKYALEEIHDALASAAPEAMIAVVDWSFRYGIFDGRKGKTIGLWGEFFSQFTAFEHARRRFLGEAYAVVNADIDELILCESKSSIFKLTKESKTGYLCLGGRWVSGHTTAEKQVHSFQDYYFLTGGGADLTETKWCIDPQRCPDAAQWHIHTVPGMYNDDRSFKATIRHFKAINTNWDVDTFLSSALRTDITKDELENLACDHELKTVLQQTFLERPVPESASRQGHTQSMAHGLRVKAGKLERRKKIWEALRLVEKACSLIPDHPGFKLYYASLLKKLSKTTEVNQAEEQAHEILRSDAAAHCQEGRMHVSELEFEKAKKKLNHAITLDPFLIDAYENIVTIHHLHGEIDKGRDALVRSPFSSVQNDVDVVAAARLSLLFERIEDIPTALRYGEIALSQFPCVSNYHRLGQLKLRLGDNAGAFEVLSSAMALHHRGGCNAWAQRTSRYYLQQHYWDYDFSFVMADLGKVLLRMGRITEAAIILDQAKKAAPLLTHVYLLLAKAHALLGSAERAQDCRDRYSQLSSAFLGYNCCGDHEGVLRIGDPMMRKRRRAILQRSRLDYLKRISESEKACAYAIKLAEDKDALPATKLSAINVLLQGNQLQIAEQCMDRFIHEHETPWATYPIRTTLAIRKGDFEAALALINEALESHSLAVSLQAQRINILLMLGRDEAAMKAVQNATKKNPYNVAFLNIKCRIHLRQHDCDDALEAAKAALAIDASFPSSYVHLSKVQLRLKLYEEALSSAQKAVDLNPSNPSHSAHLSKVFRKRSGAGTQHQAVHP